MARFIKYVILCLVVLLVGCTTNLSTRTSFGSGPWVGSKGKVKVLATTAIVADLVKRVGKDKVDVISLITGDLDPHSYELVKGDLEKFNSADLIVSAISLLSFSVIETEYY